MFTPLLGIDNSHFVISGRPLQQLYLKAKLLFADMFMVLLGIDNSHFADSKYPLQQLSLKA
jgi:hypothetical protein